MGADIHMVIEAKLYDKWVGLCEPDRLPTQYAFDDNKKDSAYSIISNRNYRLFHNMAGVRSWTEWGKSLFAPPRGLPDDMSELSKFYLFDEDYDHGYHSHSWLTLEEFMMAYNLVIEEWNRVENTNNEPVTEYDLFGGLWSSLRYYRKPVRILFAFDS